MYQKKCVHQAVTGLGKYVPQGLPTHVETVVLLSKLKTEKHIEVELDMDELDLTDTESKATYDEIKQYVLDKTGLKTSQL